MSTENTVENQDTTTPETTVTPVPTPEVTLPSPEGNKEAGPGVASSGAGAEVTYEPTGDAGLDYALNFIGKHGYTSDHPAVQAAQAGDFSLIKAELATKGVAGADQIVALAEAAHARFAAEAKTKSENLGKIAAQAAGGEANWQVVRQWAATNATPAERQEVNEALSRGGMVAEATIKHLVALYQSQHTLTKDAKPASREAGGAGANTGPLTAEAYVQGVEALYRKYGNRVEDTPEYKQLQSQRMAARRAGY